LDEELVDAVPDVRAIVDRWRATEAVGEDDPPMTLLFGAVATEYVMPLIRAHDDARLVRFFAFVERMAAGTLGFRTERVQYIAWSLFDDLLGQGTDLQGAERLMGPATQRLYQETRGSGKYRLPIAGPTEKRRWPWQRPDRPTKSRDISQP
jgi:hypothetical protein